MTELLGRLRWRLLLGNLLVAAAGAFTVAAGVSLAAPGAFEHAMGGPGGMAGMGSMMNTTVTAAFGDAIGTALLLGVGRPPSSRSSPRRSSRRAWRAP